MHRPRYLSTASLAVLALVVGTTGCGDDDDADLATSFDESSPALLTSTHTEQLAAASDQYAAYVRAEVATLQTKTSQFADYVKDGNDHAAREIYADARMHWERIEPVAESFSDLDPRLDLREADLAEGETWTGWHRLEKDLWPPAGDGTYTPLTQAERTELADQLVADTDDLAGRVQSLEYEPAQLGNGAKELLDEVATGKVTGEEEIWSHTDLWDFQANVDGARTAFEVLEPLLVERDPELATELHSRFDELQTLLDRHRDAEGFVAYDELTPEQVKTLADAVNALGEPLSQLTSAVA